MNNALIKNTMILTIITLVSGLLLGFVYEITKAPIAAAQEAATQEAYQEVFVAADSFEDFEDFDASEAESVLLNNGLDTNTIDDVVVAKSGDEIVGYVITVTTHEGYGGDITFTIGITTEGHMNGISILSISETAGLGMKATDDAFKGQFTDKDITEFTVTKTGSTSDSEIDAISGATITSEAVTFGVNAGLAYFESVLGGDINE